MVKRPRFQACNEYGDKGVNGYTIKFNLLDNMHWVLKEHNVFILRMEDEEDLIRFVKS